MQKTRKTLELIFREVPPELLQKFQALVASLNPSREDLLAAVTEALKELKVVEAVPLKMNRLVINELRQLQRLDVKMSMSEAVSGDKLELTHHEHTMYRTITGIMYAHLLKAEAMFEAIEDEDGIPNADLILETAMTVVSMTSILTRDLLRMLEVTMHSLPSGHLRSTLLLQKMADSIEKDTEAFKVQAAGAHRAGINPEELTDALLGIDGPGGDNRGIH